MKTLVIVPTYNERENVPLLIPALLTQRDQLDVLVVDDGSPDGTGGVVAAMASTNPRVQVLHRATKQGLGSAYAAGFRFALVHDYEVICQMDADFSHRPEDLPSLLAAVSRADVVVGSRNVPGGRVVGWPLIRRVLSKGGSMYARAFLRLPIKDCTSGFRCLRRSALQRLALDELGSNGYGFQIELNYQCARAGLRFAEVPIVFPERAWGRSKMSLSIVAEAALLVPRLRLAESRRAARSPEPMALVRPESGGDPR